ncbi:MAG TPA: lysophospholipid acyltransferase family protein [Bdellovibrionota bacterium]|nr:lysophospholipid acyltransferase family protein [Bdellovibrionota bacterium]
MGRFLILPVLRAFAWAYYACPAPLKRAAGSLLGFLLRIGRLRSAIIRQNLSLAFPGEHREETRSRLFKEAYRHLGNLILEILLLLGPMRKFILSSVELRGIENAREALARGNGIILLSSHVGNWETMAAGGTLLGGLKLMLVTKRLKPDWLHEAIEQGRRACEVGATYEPRTMRDVLSWLKQGNSVGFVLDQYAGPPVGVRVPVFGIPVGTMTAVAAVSKRTGAPVVPVVNYREPSGRLVIDIRPALRWHASQDPSLEIAVNTAHYAAELEKDIYAHPEQWLWTHRRFKGDLSPIRDGEWSEGRARQ